MLNRIARPSLRQLSSKFMSRRLCSTETVSTKCSPKVSALVQEITLLNLKEASDLVSELKSQLNLPDTPVMSNMAMPGMMTASPIAEVVEEEEVEELKPIVNLQLDGFDDSVKIKIIKEVKAITNKGLKETKEMVEGVPVVLLENIKREEAEEIGKKLKDLGARFTLL